MAPPHNKTSRAAERRRERRQRRQQGAAPQRSAQAPRMAPLSMDPRKQRTIPSPVAPAMRLDAETEYAFVRRDLVRLTIYSVICFVLMVGVLFLIEG